MSLITLVCINGHAFGQSYGPEISHISINDGLSQNTVNTILVDEQGFLWMGTNDGLNRYDGHSFKVFTSSSADTASLSNNHIKAISKDTANNLWIATQIGLTKYDLKQGRFVRYDVGNSSLQNTINDILIDGKSIWLATGRGLFYADNLDDPSFDLLPYVVNEKAELFQVNQMILDDRGNTWLAAEEGIYRVDKETKIGTKVDFENSNLGSVACIDFFDHKIWAGIAGGLVTIKVKEKVGKEDQEFEISRYQAPNVYIQLSKILKDTGGTVWVGTQSNGIYTLDHSKNILKEFVTKFEDNPHVFSTATISEIYEDKSKNVWIGSLETGVFKVRQVAKKFGLLRSMNGAKEGLSSNRVRGLVEEGDHLWIATAKGLNRYNRKTLKCEVFEHNYENPNSIISNDVRALDIDKNGNLWIGTNEGLDLYDQTTLTFSRIPIDESQKGHGEKIRTVKILSDGNVWVGSLRTGIAVIDPTSRQVVKRYLNEANDLVSLSSNNVMNIFESSDNQIWIATYGGGLNKLNADRENFTRIVGKDPGKISKLLTSIHEDPEGYLWVGSYGDGLYRIDPRNFSTRVYTEEDGLSNNVVYAAIPHGNAIWISTNHGLNKFNRLLRNISKYNVIDGLQSNEFNSGSYLKSESGELFFGGVNGLTFFYPDSIKGNELPPQPAFTDFKIFNESVMPGEVIVKGKPPIEEMVSDSGSVSLAHFHNVFTVEFASLDFSSPEDNTYAYQLTGFDKDWIYTDSQQRSITYTNLKPGSYSFQMKAANDDGVWNEQPIVLFIDIAPALWQRWWFRLLVLFTIVSFAATYVYSRVTKNERRRKYLEAEIKKHTKEIYQQNQVLLNSENHLKSVNRKKDQMFYALAHHVRGPLTSLFSLMKYTNSEDKMIPEGDRMKYITQLNEKVGHSLLLLDNTYYWSLMEFEEIDPRSELVNISQLVAECIDRHRVAALSKNISIHLESDQDHYVRCDRNMTSIIIQNLITNAIKYSHMEDSIQVHFKADVTKIKLVVEDTGVGMNAGELQGILNESQSISTVGTQNEKGSGLGLQLSNRMAKKMNFNLFADCEKSCTKFYLDMPVDL